MIFSLSNSESTSSIQELPATDVYCFFHQANAVFVPESLMWVSVLASLRLKKNVLILEKDSAHIPHLAHERWLVGEHFLYLAPRANSVLLEAIRLKSSAYQPIKTYLTTFK